MWSKIEYFNDVIPKSYTCLGQHILPMSLSVMGVWIHWPIVLVNFPNICGLIRLKLRSRSKYSSLYIEVSWLNETRTHVLLSLTFLLCAHPDFSTCHLANYFQLSWTQLDERMWFLYCRLSNFPCELREVGARFESLSLLGNIVQVSLEGQHWARPLTISALTKLCLCPVACPW